MGNSSRPKLPSPSGIWDRLNVRILLAAMLLCLCLRPAGADEPKCSPSERALHRRRLTQGDRTPQVLQGLMKEIDQAKSDTRRRLTGHTTSSRRRLPKKTPK